jgi:hypothetical protein
MRQAQAPEFPPDHDADLSRLVGPNLTHVTQPLERARHQRVEGEACREESRHLREITEPRDRLPA